MLKKEKIFNCVLIFSVGIFFLVIGYNRYAKRKVSTESLYVSAENETNELKNTNTDELYVDENNYGKDKKIKMDTEEIDNNEKIVVEIKGEVENPGVYELTVGDRIVDLIYEAGGLTEDSSNTVNQAKILEDQDSIIIYSKNDVENQDIRTDANEGTNNKTSLKVEENKKYDLNKATIEELKEVPGIGDVTARNIIDYRDSIGFFKTVEDIKNVNRIGDKTYEKFKNYFFVK